MFTQHNRLTTPFPEPMLIVRDMRLHGKIKIKLVMSGNCFPLEEKKRMRRRK
jgi:hypothetical protein